MLVQNREELKTKGENSEHMKNKAWNEEIFFALKIHHETFNMQQGDLDEKVINLPDIPGGIFPIQQNRKLSHRAV